jgi:hypothetical protein
VKLEVAVLKERVAERYDPDYLVDVLNISSEELVDAFEDRLVSLAEQEFSEVLDMDEDTE